MKTFLRFALGSVLAGATLSATASAADLYVKFKPNASTSLLNASIGAKVVKSFPQIGWQVVRLPRTMDATRGARYYRSLSTVSQVSTPVVGKKLVVPNDPLYGPIVGNTIKQYQHAQIGMPAAWELSLGSPAVTVAIIDTGVRKTHEDLVNQMRTDNRNTIEGQTGTDITDNDGHGTHVAGIAAATTNNAKGGAGTAWNVRILGLKAGDPLFPADAVVEAILYAADQGAQVINMSIGFGGRVPIIDAALQYAHEEKDVVLVAAAGNDNLPAYGSPALGPGVLTVGSTVQGGDKSGFSNFGPDVEVAAPGSDIVSSATSGDSDYIVNSGTSMASPVVAGAAALMRAYAPELPNTEIINALTSTAIHGSEPFTVYGQVNVAAAILALPVGEKTDYDPSTASTVANEGTFVNGTGDPGTDSSYLTDMDNSSLEIRSNYRPAIGTVAGATTDFNIAAEREKIINGRLHMSLKAASGVTLLVMMQNASTGAFEQFTSARLSANTTNLDLAVPRPTLLKYLKGDGSVRVMVRTINPSRLSPRGTSFRTSIDEIGLLITSRK